MYQIDKNLIKAYKSILITRLKNCELWDTYSSKDRFLVDGKKYQYGTTIYDESRTPILFIMLYNNEVEMQISSSKVYTFTIWENLDLLSKIISFRNMKKNEFKNKKMKEYENLMKNHLPDEYKRSIKISKIKNKL